MSDNKLSEQISDFVKLLNSAKPSFDYFYSKMTDTEKMTQDILHKFELEDLKYDERAKLATILQRTRRERRAYKDCVEELEAVRNFADKNKQFINQLTQLIGTLRKVEKYHESRRYFPRIIKADSDEDFTDSSKTA